MIAEDVLILNAKFVLLMPGHALNVLEQTERLRIVLAHQDILIHLCLAQLIHTNAGDALILCAKLVLLMLEPALNALEQIEYHQIVLAHQVILIHSYSAQRAHMNV